MEGQIFTRNVLLFLLGLGLAFAIWFLYKRTLGSCSCGTADCACGG